VEFTHAVVVSSIEETWRKALVWRSPTSPKRFFNGTAIERVKSLNTMPKSPYADIDLKTAK